SWPNMAAENSDGRAPFSIRYSAIARLPVWEAAPSADSQSPKPQSQAARARDGRASTSSFTRFRSKCETVTISRTRSRGWLGKVSATGSDRISPSKPGTGGCRRSASALAGIRVEANFSRFRLEQIAIFGAPSKIYLRRQGHKMTDSWRGQVKLPARRARKMLGAIFQRIQRFADADEKLRVSPAAARTENWSAICCATSDSMLNGSVSVRSTRTTQRWVCWGMRIK